jgi:hypothetical protein
MVKVPTRMKAPMWDAERNEALRAADRAARQATEKEMASLVPKIVRDPRSCLAPAKD